MLSMYRLNQPLRLPSSAMGGKRGGEPKLELLALRSVAAAVYEGGRTLASDAVGYYEEILREHNPKQKTLKGDELRKPLKRLLEAGLIGEKNSHASMCEYVLEVCAAKESPSHRLTAGRDATQEAGVKELADKGFGKDGWPTARGRSAPTPAKPPGASKGAPVAKAAAKSLSEEQAPASEVKQAPARVAAKVRSAARRARAAARRCPGEGERMRF